MTDLIGTYRTTRERLSELVAGLDEPDTTKPVIACPGWTVKDVVAHMTGIASDLTSGRMPTEGVDAWNASQVESRKAATVRQIVDEWNQSGPKLEELMSRVPAMAKLPAGDVVTHEQDIRTAISRPGAREEAVDGAMQIYVEGLEGRLKRAGLGPLRIVAGGREVIVGGEDPEVTVSADAFELLRGLTGRRTRNEVLAFDWQGEATPYIEVFSNYGWPESSLGE